MRLIIILTAFFVATSLVLFNFCSKTSSNNQLSLVIIAQEAEWDAKVFNLNTQSKIKALYIYDENTIFGVNNEKDKSTIFKTKDNGLNWEKLQTIDNFKILDLYFFNLTEGILISSKIVENSEISESGISILRTDDGGISWKEINNFPDAKFFSVKFNENIGIINGLNKGDISFLAVSDNNGASWKDYSDNFNKYLKTDLNPQNFENISSIIFGNNKDIIGVSNKGIFHQSFDYGKNWKEIAKLELKKSPTISINKFGILEEGNLWAAGSSMSIEGQLVKISVQKTQSNWETFELKDYYFTDVVFLSKEEVLATGYKLSPLNSNSKKEREGVILYSKDSGKSWKLVSKTENYDDLNLRQLKVISDDKILFLNNKNLLFVLSKKQNVGE